MTEAIHPNVNEQNHNVQQMPTRFQEGDTLKRIDTWTDGYTSYWDVVDVEESAAKTDVGYRYQIEQQGDERAMFVSHGELQVLAARGELDW